MYVAYYLFGSIGWFVFWAFLFECEPLRRSNINLKFIIAFLPVLPLVLTISGICEIVDRWQDENEDTDR